MRFELGGRQCELLTEGNGGPLFFVGIFPGDEGQLFEAVRQRANGKSFGLFLFRLNDWKRDCAPWRAEIGGEVWESGAEETLEWLTGLAMPRALQMYPAPCRLFTAGYSMSGLLALWMAYRSARFGGAACCSGSLWYPGWETFASERVIGAEDAIVYLSLGGREGRGCPEYMAGNESRTRAQAALLKKDARVRETALELNPGGHFTKTTERLAKGIAWLIERAR